MHPDHVEETIELAGRELTLIRPASADALIDEETFDEDEFLPYWAELWASGVSLARAVGESDLKGARVLELGADLLYEARNAAQLLALLPELGSSVLLADPGRPFAKGFLERAKEQWLVDTEGGDTPGVAQHRLRLR